MFKNLKIEMLRQNVTFNDITVALKINLIIVDKVRNIKLKEAFKRRFFEWVNAGFPPLG